MSKRPQTSSDAPDASTARAQDPVHLLEELRVHQVELEMQNEELRTARQQIEAGLSRYTEIFELAPVGYVVLDRAGIVLEVNREFARMIGRERKRFVGWPFAKNVDDSHRSALAQLLAHRFSSSRDQETASLEVALLRDGGDPLPVRLVVSSPVAHRAGGAPGLLVAVVDISAWKQVQAAREDATRKEEFLAALSHELRNPLFPVTTSIAVLHRAEPGSPEAHHAVDTIDRQVSHLVHIVDDLLDVTRIARGKISLHRERLDLAVLVRHAMDDHRSEFQAKGIALEGRFGDAPVWVEADATRLVQVIGNLLVNALKFTPTGGRVEMGLASAAGRAVLWVHDNGAGIPEEVRDRLFVPFTQAPQTLDRASGGLGLGLATVKGLVELHGGAVEVHSEGTGTGSEFRVELPLAEAPAAPAQLSMAAPASSPRRVLVIEDNVDAADAMRELIAFEGHDARAAYEGSTGLAIAQQFHPEIVFCDIGLPGIDGYEVARRMRADPALAGTYLVALSGYARPEDRRRSAEAGFDCHIAKPPSEQEIEQALAH